MADISTDQLTKILDNAPSNVPHDDVMRTLIKNGHTFSGKKLDPKTLKPLRQGATSRQEQPIQKATDQISTGGAVLQATKEALGTDIPFVGKAMGALRKDIPSAMAEHGGLLGAVAGTVVGTAGEMLPKTIGDLILQEAAGPVLKGTKGLVKAVAPAISEAASSIMAREIGVAKPFVDMMKKNPQALKNISEDMTSVLKHAESMGNILKRGADLASSKVGMIEDQFLQMAKDTPKLQNRIMIDDVAEKFRAMVRNHMSLSGDTFKEGTKLSKINAITGTDASLLQEYSGDLNKLKKGGSFIDLLRLRRKIGNDIAWKGEGAPKIGSQTNRILTDLRDQINKKLGVLSPELREADAVASKARKQYDILQKSHFGGRPEQVYNRVKLSMQRGTAHEELLSRAAEINSRTEKAMKGLMKKVAAQQFAPLVRGGISGGGLALAAATSLPADAILAMSGHSTSALVALLGEIGALAGTSPRMGAERIKTGANISEGFSSLIKTMMDNPAKARAMLQGAKSAVEPSQ